MMNRILTVTFLMLSSLGVVAQEMPWRAEWARTISLKKTGVTGKQLKIEYGFTKKAFLGSAFADMNALIAKLSGIPNAFITPEYMNYYMGYEFIGHTDYADNQDDLVRDPELRELDVKSENGSLKIDDMKNNRRWIRIVTALDKEEVNCISISVIGGVVAGCGDVWQKGLTEDEVVCHNGFNYLKCHVDCLDKIYNRRAPVTSGYCAEKQ